MIRSNSECVRYRETDPVKKKFCTLQAVWECAKSHCDQIDAREDINKCISIKFEIWLKSLQCDGHLLWVRTNAGILFILPLGTNFSKIAIEIYAFLFKTRARLGRVAPLDRPISMYKNDDECRFVSQNDQMTLKVKVNASHFQYQLRESQDAYLVQIWWF